METNDIFKKALKETSRIIPEPIKAAPSDQYGGVVMNEENLIRASRVLQSYGSERKPLEDWKDAHNKYPGLNVSSKAEVAVGTEVDSIEEEEEER